MENYEDVEEYTFVLLDYREGTYQTKGMKHSAIPIAC
mgnify:CR=1 FL=1